MNSFKAKIDGFGDLCKKGEQIADDKMKPILEEIERLENAEETRKDELLASRLAILVANGGKSIDGVIFEFDFNPNIFFNSVLLRDTEDAEWDAEYKILTESYQAHLSALKADEDAKAAKESLLSEWELELQAKTISIRKKELKLSGFVFIEEIGTWTQDHASINEGQIKSLSDKEWDALISGEEVKQTPETSKISGNTFGGTHSVEVGSSPNASIADEFAEPNFDDEEVSGFEDEVTDVEFEEPTPAVESEPKEAVMTRSFVFSFSKPFVEYPIGDKFVSRI